MRLSSLGMCEALTLPSPFLSFLCVCGRGLSLQIAVAFLASWWLSYWSQHQQAQAPATTNTDTTTTGTTTGTSNTDTSNTGTSTSTGTSTAAVVSEPSPWFFLGIYVVINTAVACTSLGKVRALHFGPLLSATISG